MNYKYPLSMVRPDYEGITKTTPKSLIPPAPELTYSKHTPPHFMNDNNPEKYFKSGEKYTQQPTREFSVYFSLHCFGFILFSAQFCCLYVVLCFYILYIFIFGVFGAFFNLYY